MSHYIGMVQNHPMGTSKSNEREQDEFSYEDEYLFLKYNNLTNKEGKILEKISSYSDEKLCMIISGEIYNLIELENKLLEEEYELSTGSEAEIIGILFKKYKEQAFKHLRGKFAIIAWDKENSTLYGARDPFGIKPLFYRQTTEGLCFATKKQAITETMDKANINKTALHHYLSFQYVPEPMTMTKEIELVEPGHYFIKKPGEKISFERYWHSTFRPVLSEKQDWIKCIQDVMYDSVNVHMRSDLPVGAFLSGGIDSTLIVAMAKKFNPNIKTFSVGFEQEGFSEVNVAKETADKLDVENISYTVTPEEYVEKLPEIMWHMDDPLADPSCVPLYFVAREARKHVETVLSGEGSDELFGGYNIYREPESLKVFNTIPTPVNNFLSRLAYLLPEGVKGKSFLERGTTPIRDRYIGNAKMFEEYEKDQILKKHDKGLSYLDITAKLFDNVEDYPLVNQMQYVDIHTWLPGDILLKAEKMSTANLLEVRMPFLDKEVFRVANGIPVDLKIANGTTKSILREASYGIIPDHILNRKKLGFPVPIRHWLKFELNSWAKQLIHDSETDDLLHKTYVLDLLDAHCQNKGDYSRKIWTILMFMLWHQIFIENKFDFSNLT